MRRLSALLAVLALGCATSSETKPDVEAFNVFVPTPPSDGQKHYANGAHHPIPKQCASGCDVAPATVLEGIDDEDLRAAFLTFAALPAGGESTALDTLLFHAVATTELMSQELLPLSPAHRARLLRELSRDHALISFRLVDEHGVTRAWLDERAVPLGIKQHLDFSHLRLPGLVASGTIVRVGTEHLWTRV